jgi:hypothetical protein
MGLFERRGARPSIAAPEIRMSVRHLSLILPLLALACGGSSPVANPAGNVICGSGVAPQPPGTPPPATDPSPPPLGGNGSNRFEIGTDLGTGGLTVVDPAAGEPTVEGLVVVSFVSPGGPAPADAVVTLNGVPLTRPSTAGLFWHVDPAGPQPKVGGGGELVLVATATDPATGKQIQRTLALQCPSDIPVTITPAPGAPLVSSTTVNLKSDVNILLNQTSPLFSVYGPKITLRGYDPCTRALGDGVSQKDIVTANAFNVDVPVLATTSGAYLLDLRWPGTGFLDGQTGGYCQLAKRFFFKK